MFRILYKLLILYSLILEDFSFVYHKRIEKQKIFLLLLFLKLFKAFVLFWKIDECLGDTGLEGDKKFSYDEV